MESSMLMNTKKQNKETWKVELFIIFTALILLYLFPWNDCDNVMYSWWIKCIYSQNCIDLIIPGQGWLLMCINRKWKEECVWKQNDSNFMGDLINYYESINWELCLQISSSPKLCGTTFVQRQPGNPEGDQSWTTTWFGQLIRISPSGGFPGISNW